MHNLELPPLAQLARELRAGTRNPNELAELALARQAATASLSAFVHLDPSGARRQAAAAAAALASGADPGPLAGLPISIKDLYGVTGWPTHAGTPRRLGERWEQDGTLVRGVRGQLATFIGKTHTVELAFGGLGTNPHWPAPRNPWDAQQHRVPGGSSSGAAVSIATGSALVAFGTDTAGSVRIPASMTGCVGLKTTRGRWPTDGIFPLSRTFDTPGVLTRTVADAAFAFTACEQLLRGPRPAIAPRPSLYGLRLGVPERFFADNASAGVTAALEAALHELEAAGAILITTEIPEADEVFAIFRKGGLAAAECYAYLAEQLPDLIESLDPAVAERVRDGATLSAADYLRRRERLRAVAVETATRLRELDLIATLTVPLTPPTLAEATTLEGYRRANRLALRNTSVTSLLGLCALSMPVGLDHAGMPVGMQLVAAPHAEERLLAAALTIEQKLGTAATRLGAPPLARG